MNPHDYGITVRRTTEDGEPHFEARVRELPDVIEYADTAQEAYDLAIDTIETTAEALAEQGRDMPLPHPITDDYSGRVTLRVPKTLHRALAMTAEEEGVSLNQHIVTVLGFYIGLRTPTAPPVTWHESTSSPLEATGHRPDQGARLRLVRETHADEGTGWQENATV